MIVVTICVFPHRPHSLTPSERHPSANLRRLFKFFSGKRAGNIFLTAMICSRAIRFGGADPDPEKAARHEGNIVDD